MSTNTRNPHQRKENAAHPPNNLGMQNGQKCRDAHADLRKHLFTLLNDPEAAKDGLPGCVLTEYKRCNRPNCRCATGLLHGPYYYWYRRTRGTTAKLYLKRADAPRVIALCQQYRTHPINRLSTRALIRALSRRWRDLERLERA